VRRVAEVLLEQPSTPPPEWIQSVRPNGNDEPAMDPLDQLDPRRFDVEDLCARLNRFDELSDDEQDEYEFGIREYAGLDDAEHPLSLLLRNSHNATCVVRDLDGELYLIWEEMPDRGWHFGALSAGNLTTQEDSPHEGAGELDRELVEAVVDGLPKSTGSVMRF
jgi:hypothetical protein